MLRAAVAAVLDGSPPPDALAPLGAARARAAERARAPRRVRRVRARRTGGRAGRRRSARGDAADRRAVPGAGLLPARGRLRRCGRSSSAARTRGRSALLGKSAVAEGLFEDAVPVLEAALRAGSRTQASVAQLLLGRSASGSRRGSSGRATRVALPAGAGDRCSTLGLAQSSQYVLCEPLALAAESRPLGTRAPDRASPREAAMHTRGIDIRSLRYG